MFKQIVSKRFVAIAVALSACSTAQVAPTQAAPKAFPVTVSSGGFTTTLTSQPQRIVSLTPSGTEILFAIGAGKQVVAVDSLSTYPKSAPVTKLSAFTPSPESIAAYKPDLVVMSSDATKATEVRSALLTLKIPVFMEKAPTNITGAYKEIEMLGAVTGKSSQAKALITKMKNEIAATIKSAKVTKPIRFFYELDNTLYSVTSSTFVGQIFKQIAPNAVNIADAAATADSGGYPQLSPEYLVSANPQMIFLADAQYGESAKTVAARAGSSAIDAVKNAKVIALPDDIHSRWGPRLVDLYKVIAKAMSKA